jgi:hypothetical protein
LPAPKRLQIPTVYGGTYGPDLPFVAEHAGLTQAEVIGLHSQAVYHVYMIGFSAGFAYLGGLPERLHTPRLPSPRIKVPKGSVAIGGSQTGAYPAETPGGWRIIGRTYIALFDPLQAIPTPMQPGDTVQFVPITEDEYRRAERRTQPSGPGTRTAEGLGMKEIDPAGTRSPKGYPSLSARVSIEVLRPGLLTTVQDRGRLGYQKFGVPVSGGVDEIALRAANVLVGNPQGAAALEVTALGPQLRFLADAVVALTGADPSPGTNPSWFVPGRSWISGPAPVAFGPTWRWRAASVCRSFSAADPPAWWRPSAVSRGGRSGLETCWPWALHRRRSPISPTGKFPTHGGCGRRRR